jgi:hypothetical protein
VQEEGGGVRDLTVLRQVASYLDGWAGLRAREQTEGLAYPSVVVEHPDRSVAVHWRCVKDTWEGWVLQHGNPHPAASIQTVIGEHEGASDVAAAIKALYLDLQVQPI